jgi:hypothetical protein
MALILGLEVIRALEGLPPISNAHLRIGEPKMDDDEKNEMCDEIAFIAGIIIFMVIFISLLGLISKLTGG